MSTARILIIDDEHMTRSLLKQILERESYDVFDAANGNEALEQCRKQNFDLVITDILMPDKEGLETITELRRDYSDIKIIAMSGGGRIGNLDFLGVAQLMGAKRTLSKPFSRQEILATVKEVLAGE
jgi:CheY-like chemotaxis protein